MTPATAAPRLWNEECWTAPCALSRNALRDQRSVSVPKPTIFVHNLNGSPLGTVSLLTADGEGLATADEEQVPLDTTRPEATDHVLVSRAKDGDVGAFEALYRQTIGHVHAVCVRLTGDPAWAEELCQEAYVRAWQKLGAFAERSTFSTWLHRLAVNLALDARRAALRRGLGEHTTCDMELPAATRDPARSMDLERAIAKLPTGARVVYVLHDVEGYTHQEIGEMTGVAAGTSKAQLHRARRLLRKALSDDA